MWDHPRSGIEPEFPALAGKFFTTEPSVKPNGHIFKTNKSSESFLCLCCAVLSRSVMSDSLRTHGLQPARLLCPWGFSRKEYWSGLPYPPPGDLPNPGIEPRSLTLQVDSLPSESPGKPYLLSYLNFNTGKVVAFPLDRSESKNPKRLII